MHTWLIEHFTSFLLCSHLEKLLFKAIYAIQIFLFPDRLQKLQPTEVFLCPACQKNLFNTDNGATHYLLVITAPNISTFSACRDYFRSRSPQTSITSSYSQTTVCSTSPVIFTAVYPSLFPSANEWSETSVRRKEKGDRKEKKGKKKKGLNSPNNPP